MISEKGIMKGACFFVQHTWHEKTNSPEFLILSVLKSSSRGLVVFINTKYFIIAENRDLKTFFKENYGI